MAECPLVLEAVKRMNLVRSLRWLYEERLKEKRDRWAEDEYVRDEGRAEGRAEGRTETLSASVLKLLRRHSSVPDDLEEKIVREKDIDILEEWLLAAADARDLQDFREKARM